MFKTLNILRMNLILVMGVLALGSAYAQDVKLEGAATQPVELGEVDWIRDFDKGVELAKGQDKPLLILFQEVPGCSTASDYGKNVLSHPLIVEAIETLFVPVAIYNNNGGEDEKVLKSFNEPSWNNPVVRIMTPGRKELTKRLSGNYTKSGLVKAMIESLQNSGKEAPEYLLLLNEELQARSSGTRKAAFGMYCFWTGEGRLGAIDGVISTEPGFMGGGEVVQLEYDPSVISYEELVTKAKNADVASRVFIYDASQTQTAIKITGEPSVKERSSFSPDSEPKYYLSKTVYKYLPMTATQASKVNSEVGRGQSPNKFLSPSQLNLLHIIKTRNDLPWEDALGRDFTQAWESAILLSLKDKKGNKS